MSKSDSANSRSAFEARRNLLKLGTCGAMTNATFLSTLMHLKMTSAVMANTTVPPTGGYKALVCLFFNGAIDSYNVLAPFGTTQADAQYQAYKTLRTGAALKRTLAFDGAINAQGTDGYLLPINDSATGRTFGLHQQFQNLQTIYNNGHATFVANAGALVEPLLNNNGFNNAAKIKPIGLYSHPDQQRHWQTANPLTRNQVQGWAGKMADAMTDDGTAAAQSNVFTTISTAGQSILLTGNRIAPYAIGANGAVLLSSYGTPPAAPPNNAYDRMYRTVTTDLASQTYADLLEKAIKKERLGAKDAALAFQEQFTAVTFQPGITFPTANLGASLGAVAKAIKLAKTATTAPLQQQRQIFLVQVGGWDHHASLLTNQNTMIPLIDDGLKAFYDFLVSESMLSDVTLFSISDFSRTLSFNGSGTDHAWGANTIVMGGAVNGGRIYGNYPDFVTQINTSGTGLDRGRGVLIPTTASDQYHAEICEWFGMPNNSNMVDVLPNIRKFYSAGGTHPLGFLNY